MKAAQFNKTTKADRVIMALIVDRAMKLENYDRMTCMMDLSACHCNGCELDFKRLFEFPVFDFAHDICGIARHINRETGILRTAFYRDAPANIYYRRIDWLPWHVCSDERLNYALENQENYFNLYVHHRHTSSGVRANHHRTSPLIPHSPASPAGEFCSMKIVFLGGKFHLSMMHTCTAIDLHEGITLTQKGRSEHYTHAGQLKAGFQAFGLPVDFHTPRFEDYKQEAFRLLAEPGMFKGPRGQKNKRKPRVHEPANLYTEADVIRLLKEAHAKIAKT